jgi:outer membrane protein assembly factor BamB
MNTPNADGPSSGGSSAGNSPNKAGEQKAPEGKPSDAPNGGSSPGRGNLLIGMVCAILLLIAVTIQLVRIEAVAIIDNALRNMITGAALLLITLLGAGWFCFMSGFSSGVRKTLGITGLACVAGFLCVVRIDEVSGDMIPRFRWAWQNPADFDLAAARGSGQPMRLEAGPLDFPSYFGPSQNGNVKMVTLDTDWKGLEPVWHQPIGAGWSGFAAVNGFAVTMEQRGEQEQVSCYDIQTGELVWQHGLKIRHATVLGGIGPRSTPTIADGRVFALGATGVLRCIDGENGNLIWKIDIPNLLEISAADEVFQIAWGRANSPLVVDNVVIIPGGGPTTGKKHSLLAFDTATGEELWRGGDRNPSYASPIVGTLRGLRQIVSVNEDNISGHAVEDGRVLWATEWLGKSNANASTSQPHILGGGQVLISKGYGAGMALFDIKMTGDKGGNGRWDPQLRYQKRNYLKTKLTSAIVRDLHAYGISDGILECVRIRDGRREWKVREGELGHGQLLGVGDKLIALSDDGQLALLAADPAGFKEYGRVQALQGKTWSTLCLYGQFLLIRNATEAACYELPITADSSNGSGP